MVKLAEIIKTNDIIKISPSENLSSALAKLTTSHDAAFVFDDDNKFEGVVNPYHDLIKSSYPGNAKVEHCLFHPPKVKKNFSLPKVIELLIESKIHYLPVFDEREGFLGIISARRILSCYMDSPLFHIKISEFLKKKNRSLVTVNEDDPLTIAIRIFKETKISKLIVVSKEARLKGILTYYDIISYLIAPKEGARKGEHNKFSFHHLRVKNFAKSYVLTLTPDHLLSEALHLILAKKIGSVVIVDDKRHPMGIITTRDLLRFLTRQEKEKEIQIIGKNLSQKSRQIVGGFFYYLSTMMKKTPEAKNAKLIVAEEKHGGLFKVILALFPKKGEPKYIHKEGHDLSKILHKIKKN